MISKRSHQTCHHRSNLDYAGSIERHYFISLLDTFLFSVNLFFALTFLAK